MRNQKMNNLPDKEAREKALDTNSSFVVVAPAGSGKTQLLIKRYLKLLQKARSIDSVICLTYTNKATEEMRERVIRAIELCQKEEGKDENEKELLNIAKEVYKNKNIKEFELKNPHSFQISTFHSFCTNLLKKYSSPERTSQFTTLDENESASLYSLVADIVISRALEGEDQELSKSVARRLAALNESSDRLKNQIITLLQNRDRLKNLSVADKTTHKSYVGIIFKEFSSGFIQFFKNNSESFKEILSYINDETKNALNDIPDVTEENLEYWKNVATTFLTDSGNPRQRLKDNLKDLPTDLKSFIKEFPKDLAEEQLHQIRKFGEKSENFFDEESFYDVLKIFDESQKVFNNFLLGNKKDFVELELSTLENLDWLNGIPSETLTRLQFKIDHILVDEAQDLSDVEYQIISKLIEGWNENDGRTLFFVGDPKQSIYKFRKANVALFSVLQKDGVIRKDEENYKLTPLELKVNFRSEPQIIDFVNKTFDGYFTKNEFADDIPYSHFLHPSAKGSEKIDISLNKIDFEKKVSIFALPEDKDSQKSELHRTFCEVVSSLREQIGEKETIAILYRSRNQFKEYLKELKSNSLEIELIEGEKLEESFAVKHLFNLLKASLFPSEDFYWLSLLGSPFINLSQKEIYEISKQDEKSWFEKVINTKLIPEEKRNTLLQMTKDFYFEKGGINFKKHFEELSGFESIKSFYDFSGVEECLEFFKILNQISTLPPTQIVNEMENYIKRSFSPPNPLFQRKKIQALTIHKAKGLEFDYVFVVGLEDSPNKSKGNDEEAILIERLNFDKQNNSFLFFSAPYEKDELTYNLIKTISNKREKSEYKRLYYVAFTRAKKGLFLFGKSKEKESNTSNKPILEVIFNKHSLKIPSPHIELNSKPTTVKKNTALNPPNPPQFLPEKIPFAIKKASEEVELSRETHLFIRSSNEKVKRARAKGTVIHKILEFFAKGKSDISPNYVRKLLKEMWIKDDAKLVDEILNEANQTWQLEEFRKIRENSELIAEFQLEMKENEDIYVGRIDLLVKNKNNLAAIDYKTSIPSKKENFEEWIKKEIEQYRPQVNIYKEMVSKIEETEPEKIKFYILFTALPEMREVI